MLSTKIKNLFRIFLVLIPLVHVSADGGYVSHSESVAVSSDQRAIIIQRGKTISVTLSTAYTGDGLDFGWVIPTPAVPKIEDIFETGEAAEDAFTLLNEISSPIFTSGHRGGCFPAGTDIVTLEGNLPIEQVKTGTSILCYDFKSSAWAETEVTRLLSFKYEGDLISINCGEITMQATGNHPFFVMEGESLLTRPQPADIDDIENISLLHGRWVEARDLRPGDILKCKNDEGMKITSLSSKDADTVVYNLMVEAYHNYTVCSEGILVHNKGGLEVDSIKPLTFVHGSVKLENYEVSVLESNDVEALLSWLEQNEYKTVPASKTVFEYYIKKGWSFVAVKMNPDVIKSYKKEFLPSLTIKYQYDKLVFPLYISSVSTDRAVKISLFIIADCTVESANLKITDLIFKNEISGPFDPEIYLNECLQNSIAAVNGNGLVTLWRGRISNSKPIMKSIDKLMNQSFPIFGRFYLTRLETVLSPEMMKEDIVIQLAESPVESEIEIIYKGGIYSVLVQAAGNGDIAAVRKLLDNGYNINTADEDDSTALSAAAGEGFEEIVSLLIEMNADINSGEPLTKAAGNKHPDIVKLLIRSGADVNIHNSSPLRSAVMSGNSDIVRILLGAGASVRPEYVSEWSSIIGSAAISGNTEILKLLIDHGADAAEFESIALYYAASNGRSDAVEYLIKQGAEVNAIAPPSYFPRDSAVAAAVRKGFLDTVKILLENGADIYIGEWNAAEMAEKWGSKEMKKLIFDLNE